MFSINAAAVPQLAIATAIKINPTSIAPSTLSQLLPSPFPCATGSGIFPVRVSAIFAATGPISRVLGDVGMAIVVRVLGLILCALAVQFLLLGLSEAIPGMISGSVTAPYPTGGH